MPILDQIMFVLIAGLASFVLCGVLARSRTFLVDVPNYRSLHERPVPRGGGISFCFAFLLALAVMWWQYFPGYADRSFLAFVFGCVLTYLLGVMDDAFALPALPRLGIQLFIAVGLCVYGAPPKIHFMGFLELYGYPALIAQVFWLLTCLNFYNFMDGLDGLAGTQAFLMAIVMAALLSLGPENLRGEEIELTLGLQSFRLYEILSPAFLCLAGAMAGYLFWNVAPAKIFMGDGGAYLLGFIFGFIGIILPYQPGPSFESSAEITVLLDEPLIFDHMMVFVIWLPFLFDPAFTIIRRAFQRENVLRAHRSHLFQLFFRNGWNAYRVIGLFLILDAIVAVPFAMKLSGAQYIWVLLVMAGISLAVLLFFVYNYRRLTSLLGEEGAQVDGGRGTSGSSMVSGRIARRPSAGEKPLADATSQKSQ